MLYINDGSVWHLENKLIFKPLEKQINVKYIRRAIFRKLLNFGDKIRFSLS